MGTEEQITELDTYLVIYNTNFNPVLVIGGGKVGCVTTQALRSRGVTVHLIERDEALRGALEGVADQLFIGDPGFAFGTQFFEHVQHVTPVYQHLVGWAFTAGVVSGIRRRKSLNVTIGEGNRPCVPIQNLR